MKEPGGSLFNTSNDNSLEKGKKRLTLHFLIVGTSWLLHNPICSNHYGWWWTYLGIASWNHGAFCNSGSSRMLLDSKMWLVMRGGGVVAELFVLASPELKPDDPFRLHPGLTIRSESKVWCLTASTFQWPGRLKKSKQMSAVASARKSVNKSCAGQVPSARFNYLVRRVVRLKEVWSVAWSATSA